MATTTHCPLPTTDRYCRPTDRPPACPPATHDDIRSTQPPAAAGRWALKSSVAGDIDAEAAAELKKLEKEALERLEKKQKELAAIIAKDSE